MTFQARRLAETPTMKLQHPRFHQSRGLTKQHLCALIGGKCLDSLDLDGFFYAADSHNPNFTPKSGRS